jgi:hypothetical protein
MNAIARRVIRTALLAWIGAIAVGIGGCEDEYRYRYLAHSDKVTSGAGNAAASNIAAQMVDPWPASSRRTRIDQNGKRAHIAVKRYETNTSIQPRGVDSLTLPRYPGSDSGSNGLKQ